ncbi:MAG TPA: hypothetical protein VFJ58_04100 [Armatimonadota bacterium]|nr:hypothetical protein [Armatimonadota bacterium]
MNGLCRKMLIAALAGVIFTSPAITADLGAAPTADPGAAPAANGSAAPAANRSAAIRAALQPPELHENFAFHLAYNLVDGPSVRWSDTAPSQSPAARRAAGEKALKAGHPSSRTLYDLGMACGELKDKVASRRYLKMAAKLYKPQWRRTKSQTALAGYALSLMALQRGSEAESIIRAALHKDPHQWMAWDVLGDIFVNHSSHHLMDEEIRPSVVGFTAGFNPGEWTKMVGRILSVKPSAAQIANAQLALNEAAAAYKRAAAIAPTPPWPRFEQGMFDMYVRPQLGALIKVARGEALTSTSHQIDVTARVSDFQEAARLNPNDDRIQTCAAMMEIKPVMERYHDWGHAPANARRVVQDDIDRLGRIGAGKDPIAAARALDGLSLIQMMSQQDPAAAIASARLALARNPLNSIAVELMTAGLGAEKNWADEVNFCAQRIKTHPTAFLWFARGMSDFHLGNTAAAENDDRSALKLNPTDFNANITLAALLLRAHNDYESMIEAEKLLEAARKSGLKASTDERRLAYSLVLGTYTALIGEPGDARTTLEFVAQNKTSSDDADNAKAVLTAIGTSTATGPYSDTAADPSEMTAAKNSAAIREALQQPEIGENFGFYLSYSLVDGPSTRWSRDAPSPAVKRANGEKALKAGHPSPRTFYDLGYVCGQLKDKEASHRYFEMAAGLYKQQWRQTKSQAALAGYAASLRVIGRDGEAETVLRAALRQNPQQWMAWDSLGDTFVDRSSQFIIAEQLNDTTSGFNAPTWAKLVARVRDLRPSAAKIASARVALNQAAAAYKRAATIAPTPPWPRFEQGLFDMYVRPQLRGLIQAARGETLPSIPPKPDLTTAAADFQEAAQLNPDEDRTQIFAAFWEIASAAKSTGDWKNAPVDARSLVEQDMDRLRRIGAGKDPTTAARALDGLSLLQMMSQQDYTAAIASARLALSRDPLNGIAVKFITLALGVEKRWADEASFCAERIKIHPTTLLWFVHGISELHLGNTAAGEDDERSALKLDPTNFDANITLAALLLKDHTDYDSVLEADSLLNAAWQSNLKAPSVDGRVAYYLVAGAYLALAGKSDEARPALEFVAQNKASSRNAKTAKALLAAIGS